MLTLRGLAIAMAGAGVLAGLQVTQAQACDNDRYPCPVVAQPQEAADAAARPQPRKKASRAARHDEKARAKAERQASQGPSQTNAAAPVAQEQAADSGRWWPPRPLLGSFFPIPPARARRAQRVNRMERLKGLQRVKKPRRLSRSMG